MDIARAIRIVTQSLFPPFKVSCDPIAAVPSTHDRLLAGYLIHSDSRSRASVLFCELHPQLDKSAKLILYENDRCSVILMELVITALSVVTEKVGINCSSFCVDDHQFVSRTLAERKLWLRAIGNVKVKLQNDAPRPFPDELQGYREAIREYLRMIRAHQQSSKALDALMERSALRDLTQESTAEAMMECAPGEEGHAASPRQTPCPVASFKTLEGDASKVRNDSWLTSNAESSLAGEVS